ncbi:NFACT family protein [Staphylococcus aureus]
MVVSKNRQKPSKLLLSIHPNFSRLQLTTKKYDNPFNPPMFARVFRKPLGRWSVESIKQIGNDRQSMDVKSKDEIGNIYSTVILEIIG